MQFVFSEIIICLVFSRTYHCDVYFNGLTLSAGNDVHPAISDFSAGAFFIRFIFI